MIALTRKLTFRRRNSRSGAAAVEFALILPVFILFMLGLIEFGRLFWVQVSLRQAVEQTARYALAEYTRESFSSADFVTWFNNWEPSLEARTPDEIYGWDPSAVTFTATTESAASTGDIDYVTIDASLPYTYLFGGLHGLTSVTLSAKSRTPLIGAKNSFSSS